VSKRSEYQARLRVLSSWDEYLLEHSGLPGPRANLELLQAVADEGTAKLFRRYLTWTADRAPVNSPEEFLACCGVVGLGRLLAEGATQPLPTLRTHATDPRWRVRESVAMALQRLGDADLPRLLAVAVDWTAGTPLEQRAAAAAVCEPRLLAHPEAAWAVLALLDRITVSLSQATDRRGEPFKVLRQGLAYCWSVAVAALPDEGRPLMEKWLTSIDPDVRWVMRQNLSKARLVRVAPEWVARWSERL
jgi:hypothetical protein